MTIADGVPSRASSPVPMTVFELPAFRSFSLYSPFGPAVTGPGSPLGLAAPLAAGLPAALAAGLAAALAAGLAPLAPGLALAPPPAVMSAHVPGASSAGIGSVTPAATTPIVTAVVPSPRSVRIAPPVMLLPPTVWNCNKAWLSAAPEPPADGEAPPDGDATGGALAGGLLVVPATPPLPVLLPHAATANSTPARTATRPPRMFRDMVCPPLVSFWASGLSTPASNRSMRGRACEPFSRGTSTHRRSWQGVAARRGSPRRRPSSVRGSSAA